MTHLIHNLKFIFYVFFFVGFNYVLAPEVLGFAIIITIPLTFGIIVYYYKQIYLDKYLCENKYIQIAVIAINSILIIVFTNLYLVFINYLKNTNEFTFSSKSTFGLIIVTFCFIIFWWILFSVIKYFRNKNG
ncbi:MAG: hypothetical protein EAZ53_06080 [Bacteroidetes bacterium]|nr:MAG: hypothetical protein EAZ53_06080 [Bacteroidota bacterium]